MQIDGKVFIVTGGASGLGEGTARMLAANGAKVVIADMQADKGEAVAKEIGGVFVKCDVSQEADGQAVVAAANNAFESVQKAVKQASDVAEANFNAVSSQAVAAAKTATASRKR